MGDDGSHEGSRVDDAAEMACGDSRRDPGYVSQEEKRKGERGSTSTESRR